MRVDCRYMQTGLMKTRAPFTPEECRENARDSRELQKHAPDSKIGEALLGIAEAWDRLALILERQENASANSSAP
jgi:hypothetical protein